MQKFGTMLCKKSNYLTSSAIVCLPSNSQVAIYTGLQSADAVKTSFSRTNENLFLDFN